MKIGAMIKAACAATAATLALAGGAVRAADTVDVKLGYAGPLTGPQAHYGEDMQNGLTLAIEEANKQDIKIDGKTAHFVLVSRDDQADPRIGVQVAQQLVDADVKGILGHFNSGTSIPASQVYHDAGLVQIAMATAPELTKQGYDNVFRMMTSDTQQGAAVGAFMVNKLGAKKVVIIDDRTAYGQGLADQVEKAVKAAGAQVVRREYTNDKATDFTAILTNVKAAAPDAIFFGGLDAQSGPMKRQLATLGLKSPLVSGEMTRSDTFIKLAGDSANGTYASLAGVPLDQMSAGKDFEQKYKARFKVDPGVYAPYAYDGAWKMITAMQQAGSADSAKYMPKLAKLQRKGATSDHISYDSHGDLNEVAVTVYEVKNGKWEMVETMRTDSH
jgi:branched-chain amino acid transport system substrate-binding protein